MQYLLNNLKYLIPAIFIFTTLVLWHELGHFLLAKINNVHVEEFSIGMGKKLFGLKKRETEYNLRLIPIGGFVRMLGEDVEVSHTRSFSSKNSWQKLSIVIAGSLFNFLLSIILFSIVLGSRGVSTTVITDIKKDSPAYLSGIQLGDKLIKIDEKNITSFEEFVMEVNQSNGSIVTVTVKRSDETISLSIIPELTNINGKPQYLIGVSTLKNLNFIESIKYGLIESITTTRDMLKSFASLFVKFDKDSFGGPITILKLSTETAKSGLINSLIFMAVLSINLALFNLIPFPALDGGWVLVCIIELIIGRKLNENKVGVLNYIGFVILIGVMILVTIKDIIFPLQVL